MQKKISKKKKGYIKGNVQFLSFKANSIKGDVEDVEIFQRMYNYMKNNNDPIDN